MKKDIYIIKNSINNKVYIGQSKCAEKRWLDHIYNARYESRYNKQTQLIHKAMIKYGYQNFHYEILEHQIENFDERERFWIKYYNSIVPNGYNVAIGGEGTGYGIYSPNAIFKTEEELRKCICEISSSNKTFTNIANKYNCSVEVIIAINKGNRYKQPDLIYPLRNTNYKYSKELLKQIIYSLKYELELTYKDICKKYNIDYSQLCYINSGKIYRIYSEKYPLREKRFSDLSRQTVDSIIEDILYSNLSMKEISLKYNISNTRVSSINTGKCYKREIKYPLRQENDDRNKSIKKFLDIDNIREICQKLESNVSINQIAKEYGVSKTTIQNINNGKCKKYVLPEYKYPIKKLKH